MHAQTLPQTSPALSSSALTLAGSMWDGSSIGISTDSNPHFLNCGKSLVDSVVKGETKRNVLIPNLMVGRIVRTPREISNGPGPAAARRRGAVAASLVQPFLPRQVVDL